MMRASDQGHVLCPIAGMDRQRELDDLARVDRLIEDAERRGELPTALCRLSVALATWARPRP